MLRFKGGLNEVHNSRFSFLVFATLHGTWFNGVIFEFKKKKKKNQFGLIFHILERSNTGLGEGSWKQIWLIPIVVDQTGTIGWIQPIAAGSGQGWHNHAILVGSGKIGPRQIRPQMAEFSW